jgi:hypothetical protein
VFFSVNIPVLALREGTGAVCNPTQPRACRQEIASGTASRTRRRLPGSQQGPHFIEWECAEIGRALGLGRAPQPGFQSLAGCWDERLTVLQLVLEKLLAVRHEIRIGAGAQFIEIHALALAFSSHP